MSEATIVIETDSPDLISDFLTTNGISPGTPIERRGLDGMHLYTVVVTLTPVMLAALVQLYRTAAKSRRHVKFIRKGVIIQGVSEKTLLKILEDEKPRPTRSSRSRARADS
jgi:hypothetical protein